MIEGVGQLLSIAPPSFLQQPALLLAFQKVTQTPEQIPLEQTLTLYGADGKSTASGSPERTVDVRA